MKDQQRKEGITQLLKGIETGDDSAVDVISDAMYIQHNPQTHVEKVGLTALFKRLAKTSPRVNLVRLMTDGDYVFGHTEYDFDTRRIGFEIFRFEGLQTVEHWDNIQKRVEPTPSGRTMVDGETKVVDREKTESNRQLVKAYIESVLINGEAGSVNHFIHNDLIQHSPHFEDGLTFFKDYIECDKRHIKHQKLHLLLCEGNFVLAQNEGTYERKHAAIYDLYRLEDDVIVEHWDTIEYVPDQSEWLNNNGKF